MKALGLFELLVVLFVALKLTGVINWSWWLVFAPVLVQLVIVSVVVFIATIKMR